VKGWAPSICLRAALSRHAPALLISPERHPLPNFSFPPLCDSVTERIRIRSPYQIQGWHHPPPPVVKHRLLPPSGVIADERVF